MASLKDLFERSCRLCAEEQDVTIQMFSPEAEEMSLLKKLDKYMLIKVKEGDRLPKTICLKCCSKLQTLCDFVETARKAQDTLLVRSEAFETDSNVSDPDKRQEFTPDTEIKVEPIDLDYDTAITPMEVNVDPQMVFQNSDSNLSLKDEPDTTDVRFLQGADGENVTLKLIRPSDGTKPQELIPITTINTNPSTVEDSPVVMVKKILGIKPFACTLCRRGFLTELALKGHIWIHLREDNRERSFKCPDPTCSLHFTQRIEFIKHLREHRGKNTCSICKRIFRSQTNLRIHEETHRTPTNAHICTICGRSYDKISNLRTHSITHSNDRPFKCHICKKSFKRNQDLKFHINQHTGNKPYKCPFCDKCFASSGNCYSHRNRMHPGRMVETKTARNMRRVINLSREGGDLQTKRVLVRNTYAVKRRM